MKVRQVPRKYVTMCKVKHLVAPTLTALNHANQERMAAAWFYESKEEVAGAMRNDLSFLEVNHGSQPKPGILAGPLNMIHLYMKVNHGKLY